MILGNIKEGSEKKHMAAIVLAGGRGKRMGSTTPKQYLMLSGKPVLYYSLKAFEDSSVDTIVLVTGAEDVDYCRTEIVEKYGLTKVKHITAGGEERYHSVFNGLQWVKDSDYVLIHDGARPFLTQAVIEANLQAVQEQEACVTGVLAKDTVKLSDGRGCVAQTPDRDRVWIVQTPQTFKTALVYDAYERILATPHIGVTDDAMVVETMTNHPVYFVLGDYRNIKITTPEDLAVAQVFVADFV